ncbi:hypothetical protein KKF61_02025 [Patescibacteria group bacterium]|nr:hypothetical protein [Patescibacteria group bacterium]MBU0964027.1 hypothetical protein [Patescibacteria group bacterium]
MAAAIYTLVVGILISLDGIVLLIFDIDGFSMPNWYIGLMLLVGVIGVILGIVSVLKKGRPDKSEPAPAQEEPKEPDN